jgi:hypothetical protein
MTTEQDHRLPQPTLGAGSSPTEKVPPNTSTTDHQDRPRTVTDLLHALVLVLLAIAGLGMAIFVFFTLRMKA